MKEDTRVPGSHPKDYCTVVLSKIAGQMSHIDYFMPFLRFSVTFKAQYVSLFAVTGLSDDRRMAIIDAIITDLTISHFLSRKKKGPTSHSQANPSGPIHLQTGDEMNSILPFLSNLSGMKDRLPRR